MDDAVRVPGSAIAPIAARLANHRRVLGVIVAIPAFAMVLSSDKADRFANANIADSSVQWLSSAVWVLLLLALIAVAGFMLFRSTRLDRSEARARSQPDALWVIEDSRVRPDISDERVRDRLAFRLRESDRQLLLQRRVHDEKPAASSTEPVAPAVVSEKPAGKPPFRVQGVHIADFALKVANRERNMALGAAVASLLVVMYVALRVINGQLKDDQIYDVAQYPVLVLGVALVWGTRHFRRSRLLQTIAEAGRKEPIAVWGVKDKWLYPLSPNLPRNQLSVVLDANEHREIYKKPAPPKLDEPQPHSPETSEP